MFHFHETIKPFQGILAQPYDIQDPNDFQFSQHLTPSNMMEWNTFDLNGLQSQTFPLFPNLLCDGNMRNQQTSLLDVLHENAIQKGQQQVMNWIDETKFKKNESSPKNDEVLVSKAVKQATSFNCKHPGCHKKFKHKTNYMRHVRVHVGEKPHKCTFSKCNKKFVRKADLITHIRTHTGERPFECPVCGKTFTTCSNMRFDNRPMKY